MDDTALSGDIEDSDITESHTPEVAGHDTADQSGDSAEPHCASSSDINPQTVALDTSDQTCDIEAPKDGTDQGQGVSIESSASEDSSTTEGATEQGKPKEAASTAAPEESIAIGTSFRFLFIQQSHFIGVKAAITNTDARTAAYPTPCLGYLLSISCHHVCAHLLSRVSGLISCMQSFCRGSRFTYLAVGHPAYAPVSCRSYAISTCTGLCIFVPLFNILSLVERPRRFNTKTFL